MAFEPLLMLNIQEFLSTLNWRLDLKSISRIGPLLTTCQHCSQWCHLLFIELPQWSHDPIICPILTLYYLVSTKPSYPDTDYLLRYMQITWCHFSQSPKVFLLSINSQVLTTVPMTLPEHISNWIHLYPSLSPLLPCIYTDLCVVPKTQQSHPLAWCSVFAVHMAQNHLPQKFLIICALVSGQM